ncbi:MAG: maleylpyruvate isomerase N-terminal domain-containing protein, partial [Acidimicrobiia bacterium]
MDPDEYIEAITRESAALADAAERAGFDAPVPSCPGWTVADLVAHIGEIQRWARITVEQRATERISRRTLPSAPPAPELLAWFREQTPALVATLAATDSATPVWSWTDDNTARFWFRRQANEVAVHRWDAELG